MARSSWRRSMSTRALFFFSSRRRHTRFDCDWSSDVCSSDLAQRGQIFCAGQAKKVPVRLTTFRGNQEAFVLLWHFPNNFPNEVLTRLQQFKIGRASCRERV